MSILNNAPGALAFGGIAAIVVGFWQQVKAWFSYISGFIIVSATADVLLSDSITYYLSENFYLLPSGQQIFAAQFHVFKGSTYPQLVPFSLRSSRRIYVRRWQLIVFHFQDRRITLTSIRGLVDFKQFISDSIDSFEPSVRNTKDTSQKSFNITNIIGSLYDDKNAPQQRGDSQVKNRETAGLISDDMFFINPLFDISFKYPNVNIFQDHNATDPLLNLYFEPHVEKYIKQAEKWKSMAAWYRERDIPWRRGWLLYGAPGTGKSSLTKAIARWLDMQVYIFYLATLSDQEFIHEWNHINTPCIVVFEDFDTVFHGRENVTKNKKLTFDCILNQISGVQSHDGIFLIVTTNDLSKIDPAMGVVTDQESGISTRPGRIDSVILLGNISKTNRHKMATRILRDWPHLIDDIVNETDEVTPVQFQEKCLQVAFAKIQEEEAQHGTV